MNAPSKKELATYYQERAPEYDEFYSGKGPAIAHYGGMYINDVAKIQEMTSGFGKGHLIDIACGTGFWIPFYAQNCDEITCLDQSANMLGECKARISTLGLKAEPNVVHADFFDIELEDGVYGSAVVGILLSHLNRDQEGQLFEKLKQILTPSGRLLIIDSLWNQKRSKYRNKEGVEDRSLNDGRKFKVFKKYMDKGDIVRTLASNQFTLKGLYIGDMLFAATAQRAA